jgi:N-acetyl-anhydromuramyl-L-alanine amidase AmpD
LTNPKSEASAHYIISRTGRIVQLVKNEDRAWANGIVQKPSWTLYDGTNPNAYTISIEHEALTGDDGLTEEQYQASLWLHLKLIREHSIPVDREHIIGHYQIDSVDRPKDPGDAFPWDRLMKDINTSLNGVVGMEQWMIDMGNAAIDSLAGKGLVANPEDWKPKLGEPIPTWLFWVMIDRLSK